MTARRSQLEAVVFCGLLLSVVAVESLLSKSFAFALGLAALQLPVSIAIGLIVLWLSERVFLFFYNAANPSSSRERFHRSIWLTLILALIIGLPLWFLFASPGT